MTRLVAAIALLIAAASPSAAKSLVAEVDLSDQRMTIFYEGEALAEWVVSTGRPGYRTPPGVFRPQRMYVDYYSIQYDGAPMPHAVFYDRGYAIHGSYEIGSLGRPASHGCIRLHPDNAAKFFDLILTVGADETQIRVVR